MKKLTPIFFLVAILMAATPGLAYVPDSELIRESTGDSLESLCRGWFQEWLVTGRFPDILGNLKTLVPHFLSGAIEDTLNRIETATGLGSRNFSYSYDSVGNILSVSKTNPSDTSSFTYAHNRITGVTYDADGNMTDDSTYMYTYDELGKLIDVDSTVQHSYDGLDKRIKKTESGSTTGYAYLGEQLLSEYDSSSLLFFDNVYFEGQLLARVTDDGVTTTTVFTHLNHLGSPVAFTDGVATVIWPEQTGGLPYELHEYEPFGADFDDLGSPSLSAQDVRYTGKLFESTTQKHYFNARYLNAVTVTSFFPLRAISRAV